MDKAATPGLHLGPELTMPSAAQTRQTLLQALQAGAGPIELDLSAVSEFDSGGVQLLLALQRSLRERGDELRLVRPSAEVRNALAVFGLGAHLGLAD